MGAAAAIPAVRLPFGSAFLFLVWLVGVGVWLVGVGVVKGWWGECDEFLSVLELTGVGWVSYMRVIDGGAAG